MPVPQLIVLGIVAMAGLATLRLVRFHGGRTPLPDGRGRRLFVVVPPIALGGIGALPIYVAIIAVLATLMWMAALLVGRVATGRSGRLVQVAFGGPEGDPYRVRAEPVVTAQLADSVRVVDRANSAFPRARRSRPRSPRAGFRDDWDVLDGATRSLEARIADDHRLGLAVASAASDTAGDARSRLDTLRRLAVDQGQAWAAA